MLYIYKKDFEDEGSSLIGEETRELGMRVAGGVHCGAPGVVLHLGVVGSRGSLGFPPSPPLCTVFATPLKMCQRGQQKATQR